MKDGHYAVSVWNGKDATLIHTDGTLETLSKSELPAAFKGEIFPGETIIVETIQRIRPVHESLDERAREVWLKTKK